jgi:oxygen-independent coproporphyrinogen-3 oxidase
MILRGTGVASEWERDPSPFFSGDHMLSLVSLPAGSAPRQDDALAYLRARMAKPQRHRLLHGYPLAAAMRPRSQRSPVPDVTFARAGGRGLLVGVLPHPFCSPAVEGCGFCTFAHERYDAGAATEVVEHVVSEIEGRLRRQPGLVRRPVAALYFGGGTANLTPAAPFRRLCRALAEAFDLSDAEVTLEGVPICFLKHDGLLLDVMREELPARHYRLSMGVQTFDDARLRQMGRQSFGDETTFRRVVELAHKRRATASADLLFNLPHQTRAEMERDVDRAVAAGFDHLGLYHLVLFRGLGTAWSRDPAMLAGLPDNETAAGNWLALRERLLAAGFAQTTLTNFERAAFRGDPRRFVYEEYAFRADRYEMLGFGPGGISWAPNANFDWGLKVLNPDAAADYIAAVKRGGPAWDRWFEYGYHDMRVQYLTRRLAGLLIDRGEYAALFGADVLTEFPGEIEAAVEADLVRVRATCVRPLPRGMFYADALAALLARRQVHERREELGWNDNGRGHM